MSTSSSGVVVRYWRYLRHTQASVVPAVVIRRKKNRQTQSKFVCQVCGYTENADINGARNIFSGRTCRACLWRDDTVGPPAEAGTHRGESGSGLNAVGNPRPSGRGGCQQLHRVFFVQRIEHLFIQSRGHTIKKQGGCGQ
uniref:Transposase InsQ for insertion sequence element IS609 n=1 Tax=Klebsiella pneumoniae TaxID=573 RepID=A0A8B0SYT1_KLEPN|nr:Putative transposase InsQ for insertion sequence element IS609 [Klebsiella pneumoniae]